MNNYFIANKKVKDPPPIEIVIIPSTNPNARFAPKIEPKPHKLAWPTYTPGYLFSILSILFIVAGLVTLLWLFPIPTLIIWGIFFIYIIYSTR